MGNSLNIDLTGKYVMLKGYGNEVFKVDDGFGTSSDTNGSALFVKSLKEGRKIRSSGYDVRRLAKDKEVFVNKI